jgi:hypothetical protein
MSKVAAPHFDLLEYVHDSWRLRPVGFDGVLKLREKPSTCFVFASSKVFLEREDLNSTLSMSYGIPRAFWSPFARKANGFFGCENMYDADGNAKGHITWFRLIIKMVDPMQSSYSWSEMSFHTRWTPNSTINFCFDVPKASQFRLHQALASRQHPLDTKDIYASHVTILDEIVTVFDESVWALRDGVRGIEKVIKRWSPFYISRILLLTDSSAGTTALDKKSATTFFTTLQDTLYIPLRL